MKDSNAENFIAEKAKQVGKRRVCDVMNGTQKCQPLLCAANLSIFPQRCEGQYTEMGDRRAKHFISRKAEHVDKRQVRDVVIGTVKTQSLLCAANLSIPAFQMVVMSANMGCTTCRDKVYKLLSKMIGFKEFTVDVRKKEVIIKGDFRFLRSTKEEA